jgi:transcriptional regulator with XRE-family HTH domain
MNITGDQCRAARALVRWSQAQLARQARVHIQTIAEFERGAAIPYPETLQKLVAAFETSGLELISENGGGAGVRLKRPIAKLARKRVSRFERVVTLLIDYRGREYRVKFSTAILDDIDRTSHPSDEALSGALDRHLSLILARAAQAIDDHRVDKSGELILTAKEDFPETG